MANVPPKKNSLSKKIWSVENKQPKTIDIAESGIDYRIINDNSNGTTFVGRDHLGSVQNYLIKDNKIYKSTNYIEL